MLSLLDNFFFTCTLFIVVQVERLHQRLQSAVEFHPCCTEEVHKFTFSHGYVSVSLSLLLYLFISLIASDNNLIRHNTPVF